MARAFFDVSGRTILLLHGAEALDLMQRISTNDVSSAKAGSSVQTVLANEKGRMVEVVCVLVESPGKVLLVGQSSGSQDMRHWVEKFIIMEDIKVMDVTAQHVHVLLFDMDASSRERIVKDTQGRIMFFDEFFGREKLTHALCERELKGGVMANLTSLGFKEYSEVDYEEHRVLHGIPAVPNELSLRFNPLEAGLLPLVSWTKGCYIGQEVISRLDSYKKVQRRLVRMHLKSLPTALPAMLYDGDSECGMITSALQRTESNECSGLGYVNTSAKSLSGIAHYLKGNDRIEVLIDMIEDAPTS